MTRAILTSALATAIAGALPAADAAAQTREQTLLHTELAFTAPFGPAGDDALGPGGTALVGVLHSLHPAALIGVQARASLYARETNGGLQLRHDSALYTVTGIFRLRLMGTAHHPARGTGPFVEAGGGVGLSEALTPWPVLELGFGWGFEAGDVDVVPTVRYRHVFGNGQSPLLGGQVIAGFGFTFGDAREL